MAKQREAREFDRWFLAVALRTVADENGIAERGPLIELSGKWPNEFRQGTIGTKQDAGRSAYAFIRKNELRNIDFRVLGPDGQLQRGRYNLNAARAIITPADWRFAQDRFNVPAAEIDLESPHEAEAKRAALAEIKNSAATV